MREHCRTQHHYDPEPSPTPSPIGQGKTMELINSSVNSTSLPASSPPVEKFLKMMANSVRFQQTGTRDSTGEDIANSMENALNYLLDNFVIVRKKEFQGISGYFCTECLSFQYRYVMNIWDERTAKDQHKHKSNMQYDANRPAKEMEGRIQANRLLIELTNSLFGGYKKIDVHPCVAPANFQGPVIKYDSLNSYQWAGIAITNNGVARPSNEYINEFITSVEGTYAQFIVASGALKGRYLISVQSN
jgi:hypothetical protein